MITTKNGHNCNSSQNSLGTAWTRIRNTRVAQSFRFYPGRRRLWFAPIIKRTKITNSISFKLKGIFPSDGNPCGSWAPRDPDDDPLEEDERALGQCYRGHGQISTGSQFGRTHDPLPLLPQSLGVFGLFQLANQVEFLSLPVQLSFLSLSLGVCLPQLVFT